MKYRIDVFYRAKHKPLYGFSTQAMKKVQICLDKTMPGKELLARKTFETITKEPLTDEELRKIEDCRQYRDTSSCLEPE